METNIGKPAISNGHQPPPADQPYICSPLLFKRLCKKFIELKINTVSIVPEIFDFLSSSCWCSSYSNSSYPLVLAAVPLVFTSVVPLDPGENGPVKQPHLRRILKRIDTVLEKIFIKLIKMNKWRSWRGSSSPTADLVVQTRLITMRIQPNYFEVVLL